MGLYQPWCGRGDERDRVADRRPRAGRRAAVVTTTSVESAGKRPGASPAPAVRAPAGPPPQVAARHSGQIQTAPTSLPRPRRAVFARRSRSSPVTSSSASQVRQESIAVSSARGELGAAAGTWLKVVDPRPGRPSGKLGRAPRSGDGGGGDDRLRSSRECGPARPPGRHLRLGHGAADQHRDREGDQHGRQQGPHPVAGGVAVRHPQRRCPGAQPSPPGARGGADDRGIIRPLRSAVRPDRRDRSHRRSGRRGGTMVRSAQAANRASCVTMSTAAPRSARSRNTCRISGR